MWVAGRGPWVVPRRRVRWLPLACRVGRPVPSLATGVETKPTCPAGYGQPVYGVKVAQLISRRQELCICGYFGSVETGQLKALCVCCRNVPFGSQHLWVVFWVGEWMRLALPVKCCLTEPTVEVLNTTVKRIHSFDKKESYGVYGDGGGAQGVIQRGFLDRVWCFWVWTLFGKKESQFPS